jgi:pantoate--beta-alanine ligase
VVFVPSVLEMYPEPVTKKYDFGPLESVMEGKYRPGHFNGVAVVVKKLFDITMPDRAYFGEKDFQQLCVIRALVKMEEIPVEIVPCPTVREADGLAMSSRNRRLTEEERAVAAEIYRAMLIFRQSVCKVGFGEARRSAESHLTGKGFEIDYVEMAATPDLVPLEDWPEKGPARIFVAAFLGKVRLIDNLEIIS